MITALFGKIIDIIGVPITQSDEVSARNVETISSLCFATEKNSAVFLAVDPSYHLNDKR